MKWLTPLPLEQFTEFYYSQFDQDRSALAPLYVSEMMLQWRFRLKSVLITLKRDNSMLTFESDSVAGAANIVGKLAVRPLCLRLCGWLY